MAEFDDYITDLDDITTIISKICSLNGRRSRDAEVAIKQLAVEDELENEGYTQFTGALFDLQAVSISGERLRKLMNLCGYKSNMTNVQTEAFKKKFIHVANVIVGFELSDIVGACLDANRKDASVAEIFDFAIDKIKFPYPDAKSDAPFLVEKLGIRKEVENPDSKFLPEIMLLVSRGIQGSSFAKLFEMCAEFDSYNLTPAQRNLVLARMRFVGRVLQVKMRKWDLSVFLDNTSTAEAKKVFNSQIADKFLDYDVEKIRESGECMMYVNDFAQAVLICSIEHSN